jgi:hypothetical protein
MAAGVRGEGRNGRESEIAVSLFRSNLILSGDQSNPVKYLASSRESLLSERRTSSADKAPELYFELMSLHTKGS